MCHTWLRQNSIAKCLLISSRTRSVVHKLLFQPCEVAPWVSKSLSSASWASLKRRGRPAPGFILRISPASTFRIHTVNDLTSTPKIREMTAFRSPRSTSSTARRRRNSAALSDLIRHPARRRFIRQMDQGAPRNLSSSYRSVLLPHSWVFSNTVYTERLRRALAKSNPEPLWW